MIAMLLLIDMIALIDMLELLRRGGGGGEHRRNIGVGSKAHKKVKVTLKSNINVTKKYWGQMTAKSLIVFRKVGTYEGESGHLGKGGFRVGFRG